ncbi:MAG: PEGA domain-containing protein, partial [Verrucomicrobiia bacterium]
LETRGSVKVQPEGTTRFDMSLRPLFGLILAESFPNDAEVLVDNVFRGKTPVLMTDLPAGQHRIVIKKDGYESKETVLNIQNEGDRQPKLISLELRSLLTAIKIISTPEKAKVYLDGSYVGESPQSIQNVLAGKHRVRVELDGYEPFEQEAEVKSMKEFTVDALLKEKFGRIKVDTDPTGGEVFLNSEARGKAPVTLDRLHEGEYAIRITKHGFDPVERKVTLKKGADLELKIPFAKLFGILQVTTIPAGVQIFVDNDPRGVTQAPPNQAYSSPLIISNVPQGQRIIKFVRPGCADVQVVASIQDGQTTTISNVQLKRLFIPDTVIVVKDGRTLRGLIGRVENDGTVHFETAPGIFVDVLPDDIVSKKPIAPAVK